MVSASLGAEAPKFSSTAAASTTVGTPMPITGAPREARSRGSRRLPTPEPGAMPPSQSCTVRPSRARLRVARASTAITAAGRSARHTAPTSSLLSTPVRPSTPARITATDRRSPRPILRAHSPCRWRVASTISAAWGPTASGVMAGLPSPATSTGPVSGSRAASSSATPAACSLKAFSSSVRGGTSTVT